MLKIIKVKGDWSDELKHYEANCGRSYLNETLKTIKKKKKWSTLNKHNLVHHRQNIKRNSRGFVDPKTMPTLEKLRKIIGLDDCQMLILQYARGETNLYHRDYIPSYDHQERVDVKMKKHNNPVNENYERILLMLKDRAPGQFMQMGNKMVNDWKAGDLYIYDTKKLFHSAGNCGDEPRLVLRITGEPTKKYREFLKKKEVRI